MNSSDLPVRRDPAASQPASPAPGREAIAATLDVLYKGRQPRHFQNPQPMHAGGADPLDSISVWQRAEPVPHWHYVTYGLTDLFDKRSGSAASGFGFELTFRLAADPRALEAPLWPLHLLQSLARYVVRTGNGFHDGHRMSTNGPITLGTPTALCSLAFTFDPELPAIDTANGSVAFLQVVGLTRDEEAVAHKWDTRKLLATMHPCMPLYVTDLERHSFLTEPGVMVQATEGIRKDGSSSSAAFTDLLDVRQRKRFLRKSLVEITLGARQIEQLAEFLPLRLPFGKPFSLVGPRARLFFDLGRKNEVSIGRDGVVLFKVNAASVKDFATLLHPRKGVYKLPSFQQVLWDVKPTTIRNAEGDVVEVIG
ncbi:suppressor of fused domain protein [Massilia sp. PAMC28688]|uniref:suppressor of fused domain protein n=1 Tax=Massilia sp. PAMC28688 TaxID=2861283 RepID=UPI001C639AD7|nr:suppressor of fused domain protein [Massilia sp. PAMC28688]QYF93772.1 suppressor of fused domain protein [Massilia sp. PAMC28688]